MTTLGRPDHGKIKKSVEISFAGLSTGDDLRRIVCKGNTAALNSATTHGSALSMIMSLINCVNQGDQNSSGHYYQLHLTN